MSIFDKLEIVVRYATQPTELTPLSRQPAGATCDIIDENGDSALLDVDDTPFEHISLGFGSRDVAVLLARDEPPRVCRRLHSLRGWSHEQAEDPAEVFAGGA